MALKAITANSLAGQIDQLNQQFEGVEATAKSFETMDRKARDILFNALTEVYEFGENLFTLSAPAGVNIVREFFVSRKIPYNTRAQANPYIGLVKLAFPATGESSRSQYATVLNYASSLPVDPGEFHAWLSEDKKGIEGRRSEALDAQASQGRAKHNQRQQTRVTFARNTLAAKPASDAVALPAGIQAPEGFALVLAKVDDSNNVQIVEVVHSDPAKVDPILLNLVEQPATLSSEPLAPFFRAVELILNTTPDKTKGKPRHLLVRNLRERGEPIAIVEAVSEAYSFPGASMTLKGHVGSLAENGAFLLDAADARHLIGQSEKLANWTLDAAGQLNAEGLKVPLHLTQLTEPGSLRVPEALPCPDKPLRTVSSTLGDVVGYIEHERADMKRKNASAKQPQTFPTAVSLSIQDTRLSIKLPQSLRMTDLAETSAEAEFDDVTLAVDDIEAVARALSKRDIEASGWIMDSAEMDDAALVLEMHFDNDLFRIVMPTRTGSDYNQVCKALTL